jgi:predicted dehydrogenase
MTQRVGILGSDNSHAERFPELLNLEDHPSYWPESGARVHSIWGVDPGRTREVATNGRIPVVASSPEEVVEQCDMVFVVARHGGLHLDHARPVIAARKPLFVDKPFTHTPDQARELISLVEESGIPMTSFSTLRYGSDARAYGEGLEKARPVRYAAYIGPAARKNEYGGIVFYAIHAVELMINFHGVDVVSVNAVEGVSGAGKSNVNATCIFGDGTLVSLGLIGDGAYVFYMMAVGQDGIVEVPGTARNYAADAASRARVEGGGAQIPRSAAAAPKADHYEKGVRNILPVLRGEKPSDVTHEQILRAIQVCSAIEESLIRRAPVDPRTL